MPATVFLVGLTTLVVCNVAARIGMDRDGLSGLSSSSRIGR